MATVGLANVYRSYYPMPKGIKINKLLVVKVAYKTIVGRNNPVIGCGEDTGHDKGGRLVLGSVPVEDDGSAYFRMPAVVPIFFQAIADDGMAVQTMRSITCAQPGERPFCLGCHEPPRVAPASVDAYELLRHDYVGRPLKMPRRRVEEQAANLHTSPRPRSRTEFANLHGSHRHGARSPK